MFRDAGSLKCSVQMGFISSLELTLECSQPICPAGEQRRARGACQTRPFSQDFPGKHGAIAWLPAAAVGPGCGSSCRALGYDDTAGWGEEEVRGAELAPAGAVVGSWSWGHSSGLTRSDKSSVQVMNCCRRGGKRELVNASFFVLNHCVELFLRTSGFLLLIREGLPYLLCVLLCGAAAGQSAGHSCVLGSGIMGNS